MAEQTPAHAATDALLVNAICELQRHGNNHAEACRLATGWLAQVRREAKAEALREAESDLPPLRKMPPRQEPIERVGAWLRFRADRIEREGGEG